MAFDIRAIFNRSLGGRDEHPVPMPTPSVEEQTDDEMPDSPIQAAGSCAASPDTEDMGQGGATASSLLIPEGVDAVPSAAVDTTSARDDLSVSEQQALLVGEVAVAAAIVHGRVSRAERNDLLESLQEVPGLEALDEVQLDDLIESLRTGAGARDIHSLLEYLEIRLDEIRDDLTDPALRRAAYQLAVYFATWDGVLEDDEIELLESIAEAFEIPDAEARYLREATILDAGVENERPLLHA